jgi:multicomponent Na+:H+ antiporter subunit F
VTAWLVTAAALTALLLPCGLIALRGSSVDRLLGLEAGSVIASLALVALAEGFGRPVYVDLALIFAAMSFAATLMFVRFVERWG